MEFPPMWMDGLTPEMVKKAEKELGETEEVRLKALEDLRKLINNETDFRPRTEDAFLLRFLRIRKFDVERAFTLLRNYYTFKARYSRIITDFQPSEVKNVLDMNILTSLPKRLPDGCTLGYVKLGFFDVDVATPYDLFAASLLCGEIGLEPDATQVCGGAIIFDLKHFGFKMLRHFASPIFIYIFITFIQNCFPCRPKSFHFLNEPSFYPIIFNVNKRFLSEKIKNRIHFHGSNLKSLHKHIPPEILPEELGGILGPLDTSEMNQRVLSREAYFERINNYGFQGETAEKIRRTKIFGLF